MYCAALCDRLEGVISIVNQPFDWQLLSAEKYFTVLLVLTYDHPNGITYLQLGSDFINLLLFKYMAF